MATAVSPNIVENNLRTLAQTKRIRVTEFFQDFDKLRSGYITEPQFFRCLWQTLGVKLTKEEADALAEKYDLKRNGQINYKLFCEAIDKHFNPNDVYTDPETQKKDPPELLGTFRSFIPLGPEGEDKIGSVLERMARYYQVHGINLRTCYEDFDKHHIGLITESQFYRSFPGPADVNEQEISMLLSKYRHPQKPGMLNYLNLHNDIMAVTSTEAPQDPRLLQELKVDIAPQMLTPDPSLNSILDKIRVAVYKYGIRTVEFFKDHDKLRSGAITANQFLCGLSIAVGKQAQLSRAEMQKVMEFYRQPDGRVRYKEFCDVMENAFNIPDLEKKPTEEVVRPMQGALWRGLKPLSEEEENRLHEVLREISDSVRRRRLMMYPYFKDFDRGIAYTRVITKSQFARILHFLSLNVGSEDLKLLCQKFEEPETGDINYPAFVQAVDQEFVGHTMENVSLLDVHRTLGPVPERTPPEPDITFEDLMARIRHLVLTNRIRIGEYLEDYDPLRSGSITKSRFRRGLSLMGFSTLGWHDLTDGQHKMICDYYQDPCKEDNILYVNFIRDVESVFTENNLEKDPLYRVPPSKVFVLPKPGTVVAENASEEHSDLFQRTVERLRQRVEQRRILVEPVFQDFDKHNNGHVTRPQFRQCLKMLELHATETELEAIEAVYTNDVGFNYNAFLAELQPKEPPKYMYDEIQDILNRTNQKSKLPERNPVTDLESVLLKIKTKVAKERVRAIDFMRDYDKLHSGRILKSLFRRALTLCRFDLTESEMAILEDRYKNCTNPSYVDYLSFCDEIESIFTQKNLEKSPLNEICQFTPPDEWTENQLPVCIKSKLVACLERIADKVRQRRMQLFPLFEDYDKVHNGSVTRNQFRRVLTELELNSLATEEEIQLIWQQFDVKIGGISNVNYIAFCDLIYELAKFEWRKP